MRILGVMRKGLSILLEVSLDEIERFGACEMILRGLEKYARQYPLPLLASSS